jgi:hypothetical protein
MSLPIGDIASIPPAEMLPEHRIPVGDYAPKYLSLHIGKLTAGFSQNYYSTEAPYSRATTPPEPSLKIRKDKPLVLDFSKKPLVLVTSPGEGHTCKPGDTVRFRAMIVEPELNLLVRGVYDTTQKTSERTYTTPTGDKVTLPRYASLAPTVTITDSSGKRLAEGTMPFG